ncbi:MAG: TonB-dependent receptor, partial [Bryobacteraceae bacterium]|nr:TonB-dependent receptor [Bryobacteraceae bacterium]
MRKQNAFWQFSAILCALAILALPSAGLAQAINGNIVGTVFDATGAAIPNATVELSNLSTGTNTLTSSGSTGEFRFNNVAVGKYNLTASAGGFSKLTLTDLQVELNRTLTANVKLNLGNVSSEVTVVDASTAIDTTTAQVQNTFTTAQALELPQSSNGGNGVLNLSLLGAGVSSGGGVGSGTGPSIGGQRPTNNSFNIEGVDNNRRDVTGPNGYVSNEATQEFSLLQNQYSPEFGHSSGGIFNTVIKSGTNQIHGSLYEYLQNRKLNAVDVSQSRQGLTSNPRFDQNRLGGTVGGPIVRNKLFYFGNFEYQALGQASVPSAGVFAPTAEGYSLLDRMSGISQTNYDILKKYLAPAPAASDNTVVNGRNIPIGILPINAPNFQNAYNLVSSSDYNISDKDQLRVRYVYNKTDTIDNTAALPVFFALQPSRSHLATLAEYHTFAPNLTNEFRAAYSRFFQIVPVGDYEFPGLDVFPNLQINQDLNVQIGPNPNGPQSTVINTYQLVNNVSWNKSRHSMKFGYDGRKIIAPQVFVQRARGDYQYKNLEQYLLDQAPSDAGERSAGSFPFAGDLLSHYAFVNDEFRLRPNLTLNLGLRYEFVDVPFGSKLQRLNSASSVPGLISFNEPKAQKNNWAPRIGIAYSPGNAGKTSIRAGFGMAYDQIYQNLGILSLPPQFSTTLNVTGNETNFLKGGGLPNTISSNPSAAEARVLTSSFVPDQQRPYSLSWNIGVQHVFHNDYTAEVRYLGTRGVHLPVQVRLNRTTNVTPTQSLPTYLTAPSQAQLDALPLTLQALQALSTNSFASAGFANNITGFMPWGNSSYHGLAAQLTRRFSNGLYFLGAYTWSHNIDDSTAAIFSTFLTPRRPQDFGNLRNDRSSSALDRRQRFTFTSSYDVPWFKNSGWSVKNLLDNWLVNGTYTYESPEYATVQSGVDSNLNGDTAGDRAIVNPAGADGMGSDVTALTNSRGATVAYLAMNPNARYIKAGPGAYANGGRNTLPLRPINNVDFSVQKRFTYTERMKFEVGAQLYNAFNHAQFVPGFPSTVGPRTRTDTRNQLIPGNSIFNQSEAVFSSNPRVVQIFAR